MEREIGFSKPEAPGGATMRGIKTVSIDISSDQEVKVTFAPVSERIFLMYLNNPGTSSVSVYLSREQARALFNCALAWFSPEPAGSAPPGQCATAPAEAGAVQTSRGRHSRKKPKKARNGETIWEPGR